MPDYRSLATLLQAEKQKQQQQNDSDFIQQFSKKMADQQNLQTQGDQHLAQIAAQGDQARQSKQEAYDRGLQTAMQATGTNNPEEAMQKLYNTGGSLKLEDIGIGADPVAKNAIKNQNDAAKQAQFLTKQWQATDKGHHEIANSIVGLHAGLDENSSVGDKNALIAAARLGEGPGQRLLQSVIQQMGGDPSLTNNVNYVKNYLDGHSFSRLTPDQRTALRTHASALTDRYLPEYQAKKEEFIQSAPANAPTLAQQGGLDPLLKSLGSSTDATWKRAQEYNTKHANEATDYSKRAQDNANTGGGGLKGLLQSAGNAISNAWNGPQQTKPGGLTQLGIGTQSLPVAAQPQAPGAAAVPMSREEFKKTLLQQQGN